jgi:hypothetical protein
MESCHMLPFTHVVRQKGIKHWSNFMCFGRRIILKHDNKYFKILVTNSISNNHLYMVFPNPFENFEIKYKNMDLFFKTSQKPMLKICHYIVHMFNI